MKKSFLLLLLLLLFPLVSFGQDDIDYSSERSVLEYFDLNPPKDILEGVWSTYKSNVVIKKNNDKYYIIATVGRGLDIDKYDYSILTGKVGDTIGVMTASPNGYML